MKVQDQHAFQLFRRVTLFLERETPTIAIGDVAPQVAQLKQLTDRLAAQAATQDATGRLGKAAADVRDVQVREMRDAYMRPVAHLGLALFPSDSEIVRALAMPRFRVRANQLVISARGMATAAEPHVADFVAHGFAPDFVTRLRDAADRVESSITTFQVQKGLRVNATKAVGKEVSQGYKMVRSIGMSVRPALRDDAAKLAEWTSLTRRHRSRRTAVTPAPVPAPSPAPTPLPVTSPVPVATQSPKEDLPKAA